MDARTRQVVETCSKASDDGATTFPQVLAALGEAGVERYHADLCRSETVYYVPDGGSHAVAKAPLSTAPADAFSAEGVQAAIRAVQAGAIDYRVFCARIAAAGCVGYLVSLPGRRAIYYGRTGDQHVERFPPAA